VVNHCFESIIFMGVCRQPRCHVHSAAVLDLSWGGVNKNGDVIINLLWVTFCSLYGNKLGAEGGKAIGEALEVNTSITDIK